MKVVILLTLGLRGLKETVLLLVLVIKGLIQLIQEYLHRVRIFHNCS